MSGKHLLVGIRNFLWASLSLLPDLLQLNAFFLLKANFTHLNSMSWPPYLSHPDLLHLTAFFLLKSNFVQLNIVSCCHPTDTAFLSHKNVSSVLFYRFYTKIFLGCIMFKLSGTCGFIAIPSKWIFYWFFRLFSLDDGFAPVPFPLLLLFHSAAISCSIFSLHFKEKFCDLIRTSAHLSSALRMSLSYLFWGQRLFGFCATEYFKIEFWPLLSSTIS